MAWVLKGLCIMSPFGHFGDLPRWKNKQQISTQFQYQLVAVLVTLIYLVSIHPFFLTLLEPYSYYLAR